MRGESTHGDEITRGHNIYNEDITVSTGFQTDHTHEIRREVDVYQWQKVSAQTTLIAVYQVEKAQSEAKLD